MCEPGRLESGTRVKRPVAVVFCPINDGVSHFESEVKSRPHENFACVEGRGWGYGFVG
jgi:hypothetical protein